METRAAPCFHSPPKHRTMLKTGKEFNLNFEALKLPDSLKIKLPAWYHIGIKNLQNSKLNNTPGSKCLRDNHGTRTVGDLIKNTKRGRDNTPPHGHLDRKNCACKYCRSDR